MTNPGMALDGVVYEKKNIRKWMKEHDYYNPETGHMSVSPISGHRMSPSISDDYFVQDIKILINTLPRRSICEMVRDFINSFKTQPTETRLSNEAYCVRMIKTFHYFTKEKFKDDEIDMHILCKDVSNPRTNDWWPIKNTEFLQNAIWDACELLRTMVYEHFLVFGEQGQQLAKRYFIPQITKQDCQYKYMLLTALADSLDSLPANYPNRTNIEEYIRQANDDEKGLTEWRRFWHESYKLMWH